MSNPPIPPARITNPWRDSVPPGSPKVGALIPEDAYNYLFNHLLSGVPNAKVGILNTLLHKFYLHLREVEKLPAVWDPTVVPQIASILLRLNFNGPKPEPTPSRRRTDRGSVKPETQSPPP